MGLVTFDRGALAVLGAEALSGMIESNKFGRDQTDGNARPAACPEIAQQETLQRSFGKRLPS